MILCKNCGVLFEEQEEQCPSCGTAKASSKVDIEGAAKKVFDTSDHTAEHDPDDISRNKGMACLSYLSLMVLIPLLAGKQSKYAQFHAMQGVVLCVTGLATTLLRDVLRHAMPGYLRFLIDLPTALLGIGVGVLSLLGFIYAVTGRAKEVPVAGGIAKKLNLRK
ncbi:MAG: hypothetical protein FWE86_03795 [Oscillospiraceae bacterium]|nr:hypothetical protein [Oscillospiraceae bacterium]